VEQAFLKNGRLECTSCHDIHRQIGDSALNSTKPIPPTPGGGHNPLLVVYNGNGNVSQDGFGSGLCRSCHNK
jgi:hypothetical protein